MRTSEAHPLRIDEVSAPDIEGRIGITFCPGKKGDSFTGPNWDRSMEADLEQVRLWGATHVVTLIEDFEFEMLQVRELGKAVASKNMYWHHVPIVDGQPPDQRFLDAWPVLVTNLINALKGGHRILVHCRGGLGRAGTVASILLIELGVPPREAIDQVRLARPGAIETDDQERFIEAYKTTHAVLDAIHGDTDIDLQPPRLFNNDLIDADEVTQRLQAKLDAAKARRKV